MNHKENIIEQIRELSLKGIEDIEIALLLNRSRTSIAWLRKQNKILAGSKVKITYRLEKIIKLHSEGKTFAEIGRILNVPINTITDTAKKANLVPNWTKRSYYTELDRIKGYMIRNTKHSAKRRKLEFDLDYTDIILPINCPLLNEPLNYKGNFNDIMYPTLDRIDNTKGYIKGNIIVLSRLANCMKNSANFKQLETFCNNVQLLIKNQGALGNVTDIFLKDNILLEL